MRVESRGATDQTPPADGGTPPPQPPRRQTVRLAQRSRTRDGARRVVPPIFCLRSSRARAAPVSRTLAESLWILILRRAEPLETAPVDKDDAILTATVTPDDAANSPILKCRGAPASNRRQGLLTAKERVCDDRTSGAIGAFADSHCRSASRRTRGPCGLSTSAHEVRGSDARLPSNAAQTCSGMLQLPQDPRAPVPRTRVLLCTMEKRHRPNAARPRRDGG